MDERQTNQYDPQGVDLQRAVTVLLRKSWLIALTSVLCAVLTLALTFFFITPKYESSALFYVNNNSFSLGDATLSIDSGDISASKSLVDSYIVILKSRESLTEVIEYTGVNRTYKEMTEMISAASVNDTEIFEIIVTSPDPKEAELIANAIAELLPSRIAGIIDGTSAKIVDHAVVPSSPSSPSYTVNAVVGFLLGLILCVGLILLRELFDVSIREDEDITRLCDHPVLVSVPDMTAPSKGSYSYGRPPEKVKKNPSGKKTSLIGPNISFSAAESYKLLRTKLQFSFSDDKSCRVIGICSAMSGEGKSLTSINLACTLSQLNKRVLLIDCDMRRPTVAEKLNLQKKPGLSSYLTAQSQYAELIQGCSYAECGFDVIAAGQNLPNPIELLSSSKLPIMLEVLRKSYDYVILDLPPVGEVSDAMTVAKHTDGILLVVRQNVCDRRALSDALRQFSFIEARILGIVFNCTSERNDKHYYRKNSQGV